MISNQHFEVLRKIVTRLKDSTFDWAVTGSLGMALQGAPVDVHDIDLQTDRNGAYEIERAFNEYVVRAVSYCPSERIHSHLGRLEIDGIQVEIMGAIQKLLPDGAWEEPVQVEAYRRWVETDDLLVPVLDLDYEYQAYIKLGRTEKAEALRAWMNKSRR
jgi:hypothetical protein